MKPVPAQNMDQLQGNNANATAITPLADITDDNEGIQAFVPTSDELAQLAKHWAAQAISDQFLIFWGMGCGGSDCRRINNYWGRVDEICKILGKRETEKAIGEACGEAAQRFDANDWIVFRYGTYEEARAYEDKGGQCFLDFEPGVAEKIASDVMERVFRDGSPAEQETLLKEELRRCAGKLKADYPHDVIEIFGISFPSAPVLSAILGDPDLGCNTNTSFKDLTIEEGKAILAVLKEAARERGRFAGACEPGEVAERIPIDDPGNRSLLPKEPRPKQAEENSLGPTVLRIVG